MERNSTLCLSFIVTLNLANLEQVYKVVPLKWRKECNLGKVIAHSKSGDGLARVYGKWGIDIRKKKCWKQQQYKKPDPKQFIVRFMESIDIIRNTC